MKKRINNPFVLQGYEGPEYFCDRVEETEKLCSNLYNGRNVTLISPRRIGKTGLIKNAFQRIKEKDQEGICIYIDIFSTRNQSELVRLLGTAVVDEVLSKGKTFRKRALEFFSAWRPVFGLDPLTGTPTVSINVDPKESEMTLKSIFDYLKSSKKEIFIAIDEFQQVAEYPEKGTEALLRSHIQFAQNVHFIFAGSKQHLMTEMFGSPQRPFYQSTELMSLKPLPEEAYYDFANTFFQKKKGALLPEVFHQLYTRFDGYTWYIQSVLNRLYGEYRTVTDERQVLDVILSLLANKAPQYESLTMFLTENQLALLRAIAQERKVAQPLSKEFIGKYHLSSSSSVSTALGVLLDKELVYRLPDGYVIYDRFLDLWLLR